MICICSSIASSRWLLSNRVHICGSKVGETNEACCVDARDVPSTSTIQEPPAAAPGSVRQPTHPQCWWPDGPRAPGYGLLLPLLPGCAQSVRANANEHLRAPYKAFPHGGPPPPSPHSFPQTLASRSVGLRCSKAMPDRYGSVNSAVAKGSCSCAHLRKYSRASSWR